MKKQFLSFVTGFVIASILLTSTLAFAETRQLIEAVFGSVKLVVDGKPVPQETLLYNGTTYVPIRAAAEALNKEVTFDEKTKTAYIKEKSSTTNATTATTKPIAVTPKPQTTEIDQKSIISKLKIEDFQNTNSINRTCTVIAIKNNSEFNLSLDFNILFKDNGGNVIGSGNKKITAFQKGGEIAFTFLNQDVPAYYEYEFTNIKEEKSYVCMQSELSHQVFTSTDKAVISVTNKSKEIITPKDGLVLFFNGSQLVEYDSLYPVDSDFEIKPGKTISKESSCYEEFDRVKVYLNGYKK